jgi:hypothetical protein
MDDKSQHETMREEMKKMTGETGNSTPVFNTLPWRTRGDFLRKWGLITKNLQLGFEQEQYNTELNKLYSGGNGKIVNFNENEYDKLIAKIDSVTNDCIGVLGDSSSNFSTYNKNELNIIKSNPIDWQYKLLQLLEGFQTNVCINKKNEINTIITPLKNNLFSKFTISADNAPINIIRNSGNTCFIDSLLVAILANPTRLLRQKLNTFYDTNDILSKQIKNVDEYINKKNNNVPNVKNLAKKILPNYETGSTNDPTEFLTPLFEAIKLKITFTNTEKIKINVKKFKKFFPTLDVYKSISSSQDYSIATKIFANDEPTLVEQIKNFNQDEDVSFNIKRLEKSKTENNNLSNIIAENFKSVTFKTGTTPSYYDIPSITTTTTTITPKNAPLYIHTQPNLNVTRNETTKPLILSEYVQKDGNNIYDLRSIVVYVSLVHYVCFFKKNDIWWLYDDGNDKLQKFNNFQEVLNHPKNPQENCVLLCYECLVDVAAFGVDSTPNTAQVLASGGFGMVVADGNIARKLMYSKTTCDAAAIEYHNITTLYNAFERARNSSQNRAVSAALHILRPLVPRGFLKEPFEFSIGTNVERFSCQLLTDRIPGLSTSRLPHDNLVAAVRQHFPEILVMPVFEFKSQLSLRNPNESLDPERNFPRYYISNMDEVGKIYPTIDFLHEFPYAMGVLLAVFVFEAKLSMINVEILLGSSMNIYVVDLGMCNDISEVVDSGDLHELSAILTDISGPFYTKNSFPLPTNEPQYGSFTKGLWDAGVEMGVTTEFLQLFLEQLHYDLT